MHHRDYCFGLSLLGLLYAWVHQWLECKYLFSVAGSPDFRRWISGCLLIDREVALRLSFFLCCSEYADAGFLGLLVEPLGRGECNSIGTKAVR